MMQRRRAWRFDLENRIRASGAWPINGRFVMPTRVLQTLLLQVPALQALGSTVLSVSP